MPIDILHILGTTRPEGAGVARIVTDLATRLDPRKYHIHACFLDSDGPLLEELQVRGISGSALNWLLGARDPLGAWRFGRFLRSRDFSIVHQHVGCRAVRQMVRLTCRARLIVHLHGRVSGTDSWRRPPIEVRGADIVIAASRAVALQVPSVKPVVVYAGVLLPDAGSRSPRLRSNAIVIGTACRLVRLKGVADLIQAMAILRGDFPSLKLEIAGDGPERKALEIQAQRIGMDDSVHFLGWQKDIGPVLRRWDVFVLPSLEEGFGIAVLEAMAHGLPVIASSAGGLPELVEDGRTGYIFPSGESAALAARLGQLMREPDLGAGFGAAGRERALRVFSVDRMVRELADVYSGLS